MANDLIPSKRPMTVADRVREKRAAERKQQVEQAEPLTPTNLATTSTRVRARLNFMPDDSMLAGLVDQALTTLSRGVRWARGSIINLVV